MMKNAFYFILQTLFVLAIFTFLPGLFGYIEKRLDKKAVIFKIYYAMDGTTKNHNTHIP